MSRWCVFYSDGRIDTEEETLSGWKKVASEFLASSGASPPLQVASEGLEQYREHIISGVCIVLWRSSCVAKFFQQRKGKEMTNVNEMDARQEYAINDS